MSYKMLYRNSMCPSETSDETPPFVNYGRLTRRQAERVAGTSRATLYRYRDEGKITVVKEDGQTFYDAAELQRAFPDTFNLKRLETPVTAGSEIETPVDADSYVSAVLVLEKRYLIDERDRLKGENERLRRELENEREKRDDERAAFMKLISQNQETVKQLTDQSQKATAEPPSPLRRGLLSLFRKR